MPKSKVKCMCGRKECHEEGPPGDSSYLWGDKSIKFTSDPLHFIEKMAQSTGSRVFQTRLALKPTLILASHEAVTDFLNTASAQCVNGLKDNYSDLFGHSILFSGPEESEAFRKLILPMFNQTAINKYQDTLQTIMTSWCSSVDLESGDINLYQEFKNLSLAYNLEIFLGVNYERDAELYNQLKELTTTHWHGVVSLPFNFSIPLFGNSGYSRAMEAKSKLLEIIENRLNTTRSGFLEDFQRNNEGCMSMDILLNHVLLFSCALIPKAVGALLSMLFELGEFWSHYLEPNGDITMESLELLLLETARLFPPFIGGLRVTESDITVNGYHLPPGTQIHHSILGAMRDPQVFPDPNAFKPDRWKLADQSFVDKSKNLVFGTGPHDCVGRHYSWHCITSMAKFVLDNYRFIFNRTTDPEFPQVKNLPVLRPLNPTPRLVKKR